MKRGNPNSVMAPEENKKKMVDILQTRTGGAYIPPARLLMMQQSIQDKSSAAFQRLAWEALKKSINGLINKVNTSNIPKIVRELFKQNLVRGRGLLCRSIMNAQSASPTFTNVYAALISIINTKFPNIGELLLKRLIIQFRRGYKRNDKPSCTAAAKYIGHLVNQQVAHEVLALEILTLLLEHPTEDSVEVAIAFLKEVGARLDDVSPKGAIAIFERLRHVLHEANLDKRVQYMIEVMFQVRKDKFKDFESVPKELDLVEEEDQFTHLVTLDDATDGQDILNVFKEDSEYLANEEKYLTLRKEILDESEGEDASGEEEGDEDESNAEEDGTEKDTIIDKTETNLLALRRTIYLTIQSSLDYEECCHKLLKMNMKEGQEVELCHMILDCCAQQRTYEKFFGLMAGRFCAINIKYVGPFQNIFKDTYDTVHRLDTNKLRNVSKFFAHLLFTDSISWTVVQAIRLTEEDTTSSSRIFVKILFQELSEYMGLQKLNQRLNDPTLVHCFEGLFPRDHPKNTRFAINFFTSIGLGGLTDELREHLKRHPKPTAVVAPQTTPLQNPVEEEAESSSSSSSSSSSDSSSSSSDSSSSSSSSSSDDTSDSSSSSSESPAPKKKKKSRKEPAPPKTKTKSSKKKTRNSDKPKRDRDTNKRLREIEELTREIEEKPRHAENQEIKESRRHASNSSRDIDEKPRHVENQEIKESRRPASNSSRDIEEKPRHAESQEINESRRHASNSSREVEERSRPRHSDRIGRDDEARRRRDDREREINKPSREARKHHGSESPTEIRESRHAESRKRSRR